MPREHSQTSGAPFKLSWPAIFGGLFAATGVWLLLYALGLALGFSQFDLQGPNLARAAAIGTSVWVVLSSFLSMFVGGLVTARSAGYLGRGNGALHGIVLWGATAFVGTVSLAWLLGSVSSQFAQAGSQAVSTLGQSGGALQALGINTDDLLDQVNAQLTAAGKPTVTAEQLRASVEDAATAAVSRGRLDQELFVGAIAENTQLTEEDARQIFAATSERISQRVASMRGQLAESTERIAEATGRVFWGLFALLTISLVGSVLGASTGVTRRQRELVTSTLPPLPPMGARPGEAYP